MCSSATSCVISPQQFSTAKIKLTTYTKTRSPDPKMLYQYQVAAHSSQRDRNVTSSNIVRPGLSLSFNSEPQKLTRVGERCPLAQILRHWGRLSLSETDPSRTALHGCGDKKANILSTAADCMMLLSNKLSYFRWIKITHLTFKRNRKEDKPSHCLVPTTCGR